MRPVSTAGRARRESRHGVYDRLVPLFESIERELTITEAPDAHAAHRAFLEGARYFSVSRDVDALVEGVRLAREIAATRAYHGLLGDAIDPTPDQTSPDQLHAWIRRTADTIFHPVGTCRMGMGDTTVLDAQLRVRGVERLRVADGSVMPTVVNSQTNAACLVIGEQAARFLRR